MSEQEGNNYSSRELLRMHMNNSQSFQEDMRAELRNLHDSMSDIKSETAKVLVKTELNVSDIDDHKNKIQKLHDAGQRQTGFLAAVGVIGTSSVVAWIKHIFG